MAVIHGSTGSRPETRANPKSTAWDLLGAAYWNRDYDGGPSAGDRAKYMADLEPGDAVVLVGASTARLAFALTEQRADLTVCDFSPVMLDALRAVIGSA